MTNRSERVAIMLADLGYGDAGKGATIDALAEKYHAHTVVRYNGGAQAAHTVTTPDGLVHTFAQFGSATLIPGVATYLSEYMLVDPLALESEEGYLHSIGVGDAFERLAVDGDALLVTPFARAANRLREFMRDGERHGSCGMGVGESAVRAKGNPTQAPRVKDLLHPEELRQKIKQQQIEIREEFSPFVEAFLEGSAMAKDEWSLLNDPSALDQVILRFIAISKKFQITDEEWARTLFERPGVILFEGAQGVLLDEKFGFHPYTTWSNTTFANAEALLDKFNFDGQKVRLGVLRAYATRHGPGPFVSESRELTELLPDMHNVFNEWQRDFRIGWFDAVATRYALRVVGGVDGLVLTNIDRLFSLREWRFADMYDVGNDKTFRDIPFDPAPSDASQEKLTQLLFAAKPVYKVLNVDTHMQRSLIEGSHPLFAEIERLLGVSVVLIGHGPSRTQKHWRGDIVSQPGAI